MPLDARSMDRAAECRGVFARSAAACRIHVDCGLFRRLVTTALFADLSGGLVVLITDVIHLIEQFYRHVNRHRPTATFFVALNSDGQAEGDPR